MIERIVLLQLKDDHAFPETLADVAEHSLEVLSALPGVVGVDVGKAADDRTAESWHIALVVRFTALEDIPPYAAHPKHRTFVDEYLHPKLESIAAYNFEVQAG